MSIGTITNLYVDGLALAVYSDGNVYVYVANGNFYGAVFASPPRTPTSMT